MIHAVKSGASFVFIVHDARNIWFVGLITLASLGHGNPLIVCKQLGHEYGMTASCCSLSTAIADNDVRSAALYPCHGLLDSSSAEYM